GQPNHDRIWVPAHILLIGKTFLLFGLQQLRVTRACIILTSLPMSADVPDRGFQYEKPRAHHTRRGEGVTSIPLRRRLLLLAVAGILPLAIMAAIGLRALAQQQRTQVERVGLEFARALATAVDAELR